MPPKAGISSVAYAHMATRRECRNGPECTDFSDEHRRAFSHPEGITLACTYGSKCYRKNLDHLKQFVHPGDRNYRCGLVHFGMFKGRRVEPEFPTMRDLFNYCDPDESGHISADEFALAWQYLQHLGIDGEVVDAWQTAAGEDTHLTFAQFAHWGTTAGLNLPVGVDVADGAPQPCRFEYTDGGRRCPCQNFKPVAGSTLCECNHKASCHQSDVALMTFEEQEVLRKLAARGRAASGTKSMTLGSIAAPARKPGFDMVTSKETRDALQRLLTETHKTSDNWTRDRGCALHGRHACPDSCIFRNRAPVPAGFELVRAEKNRNPALYHTYETTKAAIREECRLTSPGMHQVFEPLSSAHNIPGTEDLDPSINEWRVMHGTALAACKGICGTNFALKKAGTGATWKDPGKKAGTPLYGWGVYLAERSTKADEYAEQITDGLPIDEGCHAMLVCRVVGGLTRLVDTNEFDPDALRTDVFDGPYHSVFGDREVKLGKPFREIVVYDNAQVFPEFILYYKRVMS